MSHTLGGRGAAIIKAREALRLASYLPTPKDKWTVGWGHTRGVTAGMVINAATAEEFFRSDVAGAEATVNGLGVALSQAMFDALVSLVFNAGDEPLLADHVIGKALRAGKWFEAWAGFALWRKQAGEDMRGLARRRAEEMALYMEDPLPPSG